MKRFVLTVAVVLIAAPALAAGMGPMPGTQHYMAMSQDQAALPHQGGQGAFAAIQEIVTMLQADPHTDWSKVNIEALRQHLIDMDNVTLRASATSEDITGGVRFLVTGEGPVVGSIRRMLTAHAQTMNGVGGWNYAAAEIPNGASLTVAVTNPADIVKVKALGFIGVLADGSHHQAHHLMIALGQDPHS